MLGGVRVRAGHEDAPVAHPPAGAPDLLAVDDEVVAVALGPGRRATPRSLPAPGSENSWHHTWSAPSVARRCCCLLLGRAVAQHRAAGEHEPDHVQHRRHPGRGALDQPRRLVLVASAPGRRARPASGSRRSRRRRARRCQATPGVDQLGRADRAVVGRRLVAVGGQPVRGRCAANSSTVITGAASRPHDRVFTGAARARDHPDVWNSDGVIAGARPVRAPRGTAADAAGGGRRRPPSGCCRTTSTPRSPSAPTTSSSTAAPAAPPVRGTAFDAMLRAPCARSPTTRRCSCSRASRSACSAPTSGRRGC